MKKKVYIAGKITGYTHEQCLANFDTRKKQLIELGFEPVSPYDLDLVQLVPGWSEMSGEDKWYNAMMFCLPLLLESDGISLLPDWKDSRGARMEQVVARCSNRHFFVEI